MTLPIGPQPTDSPEVFTARAYPFLGALPQFETDMNAVATIASNALLALPAATAASNYRGDYLAGTTYTVGQSVSSGGSVWYAKTTNLGVTPVAGANWQQMSASVANPSGHAGKVLSTPDGITTSWVVRLPTQTGQAGKVLGTDGTNESWVSFLASPAFTGVPSAPTATAGTSTTQLATTAFVTTANNSNVDAAFSMALAIS